jgi:hypothetical protein
LIDVAVPADRNVTQKVAENKWIKEFTYRNTTNVEHEMYGYTGYNWNHRNITEGLRKHLEAIQGKHSADSLKQRAVLGTSHIIWKVLRTATCSLSGGGQLWFKRCTGEKRPVTRDNKNNNNDIIIIIIIITDNSNCSFQGFTSAENL